MLKSYSLSCTFTKTGKEYRIKFDVASGVGVSFKTVGDVNQINLKLDSSAKDTQYQKTYEVSGDFDLEFNQNSNLNEGSTNEESSNDPIVIKIRP